MKHLKSKWLIIALSCLITILGGCGTSTSDDSSTTTASSTVCRKLTTDTSDNAFIGGYTGADLDSETLIGNNDIFLIKYSSAGVQAWSKLLGSSENDYLEDMATTAADDVLSAGYTYGVLPGESNEGGVDMLLIKTAPDGTTTWEKQFGSSEDDYAYGVTTDTANNIFIAGLTYGSFPGAGTTLSGTKDLVLLKLDIDGTQLWARQISNDEDDSYTAVNGVFGISVGTDAAGNVYASGFTTGALTDQTNSGGYDLFVVKYNSAGDQLWIKQVGSAETDKVKDMQVTTAGDVYLTGTTDGSLDGTTNAGEEDLFLIKLDTSGVVQWTRQVGTDESDNATGITLDSSGNILLTGYTSGDLEGDVIGGSDLIIMKYDSAGNLQWTKQLGTTSSEISRAIAADTADNLFITGFTYGELDDESNSDGVYKSFISHYTPAAVLDWTELF